MPDTLHEIAVDASCIARVRVASPAVHPPCRRKACSAVSRDKPAAPRRDERRMGPRRRARPVGRSTPTPRPSIYSAHAKVVGARTGHVEGDDLVADLTMAKALGGPGDTDKTNPEELFAAGYGACFQSAMNAAAMSLRIRMPEPKEGSVVETTVHLVGDMKKLDMGIRVDMKVGVRGLDRADLDKGIAKVMEICPYIERLGGT